MVEGRGPGAIVDLTPASKQIAGEAKAVSHRPLEALEVVANGHVVQSIEGDGRRTELRLSFTLPTTGSVWVAARVRARRVGNEPVIQAHSNPVYLLRDRRPVHDKAARQAVAERWRRDVDYYRSGELVFADPEQRRELLDQARRGHPRPGTRPRTLALKSSAFSRLAGPDQAGETRLERREASAMLHTTLRRLIAVTTFLAGAQASLGRPAIADGPSPRLIVVDPPGGKVGTSVDVQVSGTGLEGLTALRCDEPRIKASKCGEARFTIEIPADVPPGLYDLRALGANGLSSPRGFFVSPRTTLRETEPKGTERAAQAVELDVSLCGRIDPPGDVDAFRFHARAGQRVVIECWAERLDSKLRAVLELEDERGRRLASSRGYAGLDPLIDFRVPADGDYVVRLFDLTYTGSPEHVYRLDIDTGPRIEFAWPNVVERGQDDVA